MKNWLFLAIAIFGEVVATSALKSSHGFTKLVPSVVVVAGYGLAFYFLSLALKSIPVGIAYAVWAGLGIVLVAAIAWIVSALESASVFPKISSSHLKSITSSLDFHHDHSRTC
ncbi:multidrug efflux SMR transporter [Salmonella enterica subsp. enterica serovar Kentucky]|nr:multidrug efflux SMR transporter [Salmonella enterica subsp. enterica serovar Kentucky]EIM9119874.1 multidrug efflux SMR transporter [Salmonella enterica subsp. enterica serovar Kentucky]